MCFNPQGLEKLNDTSTKMYFIEQGLEKLNDTLTKMDFNQQGLRAYGVVVSMFWFSPQRSGFEFRSWR